MTPQERDLVTALFDRLAALEANPRDSEAERLITQGLVRAPHALYPLVQTVLLQDEALKRANARIEELEGNAGGPRSGGFLDSMRGALLGRETAAAGDTRGSVPSVRPGGVWNTGQPSMATTPMPPPMPTQAMPGQMTGGGSFLGTAAAAAVGMIGGSLLFNGIRNLMGSGHPAAFGSSEPVGEGRSPWGSDASGSDLSRQAGLEEIGTNDPGSRFGGDDGARTAGLFGRDADDDGADDPSDDDLASSDFGDDGTSDA